MHIFQKSTGWAKFGKQCYCDLKKKIEKSEIFYFRKFISQKMDVGKKKLIGGQTIKAFKFQKFDFTEPSFYELISLASPKSFGGKKSLKRSKTLRIL